MAKMVLKAAYLSLNGTDRSDHTSKVELSAEVEDKDVTTFASGGWTEVLGGLASGKLDITFKNDYAASNLDETMWALLGSVVSYEVRAVNTTVTTSNPKYTGSVLIKEWKPIMGTVGDVAEVDVSYPTSGAITRGTS